MWRSYNKTRRSGFFLVASNAIHHAFDESLRRLSIDGVSVGAQAHHSGGSPMSQRECAGFNWPPLSILASEPVSISPEAVSRVGPTRATICPSGLPVSHGLASFTPRLASVTVVVGQPASANACSLNGFPRVSSIRPARNSGDPLALRQSLAAGVSHPVKSVSNVRRTDARRRERDRPEGVTQGFHVSVYKVDPRVCVFARNLLSKDDCRLALFDEMVEGWPQVPLVIKPSSLACRAERLARTGTSPNRSIICPSRRPQGMGPDADAGEEVALRESAQVAGVDILNTPFIHISRRDVAGFNQVAQPLGGCRVNLVVVGGHGFLLFACSICKYRNLTPCACSICCALLAFRTCS